jgi:hypothetical protein
MVFCHLRPVRYDDFPMLNCPLLWASYRCVELYKEAISIYKEIGGNREKVQLTSMLVLCRQVVHGIP